MKINDIRWVRRPSMKMFTPVVVIDGFEIKWDERVHAWEIATKVEKFGMWAFRIGRVVNGQIFVTEMVNGLEAATDELSLRAAAALMKLRDQGVDLGEWEQNQIIVSEEKNNPEPRMTKEKFLQPTTKSALQEPKNPKGFVMKVTTKPVRDLDPDTLQALIDDGFNYITTKFNEELAEISMIRGNTVDVQFPNAAYATPIRVDSIRAVHKPDEEVSV